MPISIVGPAEGPVRIFDTESASEQTGEIERITTGLDAGLEKLALRMIRKTFRRALDEPLPILVECDMNRARSAVWSAVKAIREWQAPPMDSAAAMKNLRAAWGLSRASFGMIAGVHGVTTWRWETGQTKPDAEQVERLRAFALHVGLPFPESFLQVQ